MSKLIFVRHALPLVDPAIPPSEWRLCAEGIEQCQLKRVDVSDSTKIISSPERKSIETIALVTGKSISDIHIDADLCEVRRKEPIDDLHVDRRSAWIAGSYDTRHSGWEDMEMVGRRVNNALLEYPADRTIIGTHGMALTSWMVFVGLVGSGEEAVKFWQDLEFPDIVTVTYDNWGDFCFSD